MAESLVKKETLNYSDVEALLGPPPFGKKRLIEPTEFEESLLRKDNDDQKEEKETTVKNVKVNSK